MWKIDSGSNPGKKYLESAMGKEIRRDISNLNI